MMVIYRCQKDDIYHDNHNAFVVAPAVFTMLDSEPSCFTFSLVKWFWFCVYIVGVQGGTKEEFRIIVFVQWR